MLFKITRSGFGNETKFIEAKDREDLLLELRRLGIGAKNIEVVPDGKKPRDPTAPKSRKLGALVIVAVFVLVACAGGGLYYSLRATSVEKSTVSSAQANKPTPKPTQKTKPGSAGAVLPAIATNVACVTPPPDDPAKKIKHVTCCETNQTGKIILYYTTMDGKRHYKVKNARRSIFHTQTDKMLSMALSVKPTSMIPPMPNMSGNGNLTEKFLESLKTPIEIEPTDTDQDIERKKRVIQARFEMEELIKNGQTFEGALKEFRQTANENASLRKDAQKNLETFIKGGASDAEIEAYMNQVNQQLDNLGAPRIEIPTIEDD